MAVSMSSTKALPATEEVTTPDSSSSSMPPLTYKKRLTGIKATPELAKLVTQATKECKLTSTSNDNDSSKSAARTILLDYAAAQNDNDDNALPISVIRAAACVLEPNAKQNLENALSRGTTSLAFTPKPKQSESEHAKKAKFQKRIDRLTLQQEETRYSKLTKNVIDFKSLQQDDVTTRSMTYAASIGLNMIIAPLSFGCFMYFFSGNILGWKAELKPGMSVDIRRVIVSVISGVLMLFVEMILFVIRTHEVDKAMRIKNRKKQKKNTPFGHYTSNTERNYNKEY